MWQIDHPEYFLAFLALPLAAYLFWKLRAWQQKAKSALGSSVAMQRIFGIAKPNWKPYYLWAGLFALLILSAADIRIGKGAIETQNTAKDVVIALDVSKSMLAEDVKPNRLAFAKKFISGWIDQTNKNTRIGLVVFAGDAQLIASPTLDHAFVERTLADLGPEQVLEQGTDLSACFRIITKLCLDELESSPVIILVTDSEDHSEESSAGLKSLIDEGATVIPVGIGTTAGAPVPSGEPGSTYLRDDEGNLVRSTLNETLLAQIAEEGGADKYILASAGIEGLNEIESVIKRLRTGEVKTYRRRDFISRYRWFLIPACLLLLFMIYPEQKQH